MNAIKHFFSFISATRRSLNTIFYQIFIQFSNKFHKNFGGWSLILPETYINIGPIRFEISWPQTHKWTNKQTQKQR